MEKTVTMTTKDDVVKALKDAKFDSKFKVVATESSLNDRCVRIHLINEDKTLSNQSCFTIGIERANFRFSSNASFKDCEFLKDEKVNSKHRYEVTVKRDDIVKVLKQACTDYSKRYSTKTTVQKKEQITKKEA